MNRLPITVQREAEEQIVACVRWWAENRSVEQAKRWYNGIYQAIQTLVNNPQRCPLAREDEHFPYELRQMSFGLGNRSTHRIIFTITLDAVHVLAIRHTAQDDITPEDL